jgi:hypothetical protein
MAGDAGMPPSSPAAELNTTTA